MLSDFWEIFGEIPNPHLANPSNLDPAVDVYRTAGRPGDIPRARGWVPESDGTTNLLDTSNMIGQV